MAYVSLLSVTQSLEQILHPDDQSLVLHETEQQIMRSLNEKASFLLSFLENDSLKYSESNLEPRIRDVAYQAEAMIEFGFPHQYYEGLQKIVEELDSIMEEVEKMKERNQVEDLPPTKPFPVASTESGSTEKNDIVGLRKEMMEIKDRLTGSPSRRETVSIVGMPGIGKTTLAKTLYDDPLIVKRFDVRAWKTVSANYSMQQILTGLLDSIQNIDHDSYPEDLADHLHKTLKRRRYLLVMDDVWDTKAWDQVKRLFPNDYNRSRVILTTRLQIVANHVECPDSIYSLSLLSHEDSWKLLCRKVFNAEPCPLELEDVGKEIAGNCKGLPLSLAVVGGILYKAERMLNYWRYVAENIYSTLNNTHDNVMNMLSLTYKYLPHHLRTCFLYMGVFREDHEIPKSKLIRLWVAEGFIKPVQFKCLEEVAREYLDNLIDRNLILVRKRNESGGIKVCGIHDLLRDLCMRIALEEKFFKVVYSQLEIPRDYVYNFRHVFIHSESQNCLAGIYGLLANSPTERPNTDLSSRILSSHQLRILDAQENPFSKSKDEIVDLVGLRYISFPCGEDGYEIPSSISKLSNLETLVITSEATVFFPLEIWMMPRIRHIKTKECFLPYPLDTEDGKAIVPLENLHTLEEVTDFRFSKDAIRMMPNLKKLKIRFTVDGWADLSSYCIHNLVLLHQLEVLSVTFRDKSDIKHRIPLLDNFSLPSTLRKLTLIGFRLSPKHMSIVGSLQGLEQLQLYSISFDGSVWEPNEGEFLKLKFLFMFYTDLEYLKADETSFPILRSLYVSHCTNLTEIPSRIGDIQTLQLIMLRDCEKSVEDSVEFIKKEQQDWGNDRLQITIFNIEELPLSDEQKELLASLGLLKKDEDDANIFSQEWREE